MSSIAYVTDQEMIEYHRLCGNRDVNFWRLSTRASFSAFQRGDLLFFYAYGRTSKKKKGLVGYAHFEHSRKMSLKAMWKRYGTRNGYDDITRLEEAIREASRNGEIPETMNCLYLSDCVYFRSPVYPEEAGIRINEKLESFTYLDKDDPTATARILRIAEAHGIDDWSSSQNIEPDSVFRSDEIRQQLALIASAAGICDRTASETRRAKRLIIPYAEENGYELIRGSETDYFRMEEEGVRIVFPFVAQANDRTRQVRDLLGRMMIYRLKAKELSFRGEPLVFEVIGEEEEEQLSFLRRAAEYV